VVAAVVTVIGNLAKAAAAAAAIAIKAANGVENQTTNVEGRIFPLNIKKRTCLEKGGYAFFCICLDICKICRNIASLFYLFNYKYMMQKAIKIIGLTLLVAIFTTACNRFYKNPDFAKKTVDHKTIAILPYQIVITGRLPKEMTPEIKEKIEAAESIGFQRNYYTQVHTVGTRRHPLSVIVQPVERTNQLLSDKGITPTASWDKDPQELAKILGVDAVVRNKAIKVRFLSDLESLGIDLGTLVLSSILGVPMFGFTRTNEVEVTSNIIAANTGENLFSGRDEVRVDWSRPANEAIEQVNRRIVRRFPYVKK
jgi:hypothetical protein